MALVGDIKSTLKALLPLLEEKPIATSSIRRWSTIATREKGSTIWLNQR